MSPVDPIVDPVIDPLSQFVQSLEQVPDPRSQQGQSHPFSTILGVVFLGLLANRFTIAEIQRWAELHFEQLQQILGFKRKSIPHAITLARVLQHLSLADLQTAFAAFLNAVLASTALVAAVDGKVAKQMKDENGDPLLMLNVFAQQLKLHLASWSVHGDKTNEPNCLKMHLKELFDMYPCLQLLTGDAIFAQRPLLEAIREFHRDYLVQVKDNQPKVLAKMKEFFADAPQQEPSDLKIAKKKGLLRFVVCG
jgi:hypothetical protein